MADAAGKIMDAARYQAGQMQEQLRGIVQKMQHRSPSSNQALGLVTIVTGVVVAVVMGGITIGGIIITLLLATPVFLILSPVLIPLGVVGALISGGFLCFSAVFLIFCSTMAWLYNYLKGRHPVGADSIDAARHRIADTASHIAHKAQETTAKAARVA